MKERFMKNGVFSLEYDKETLKDMVLTLQEENKQLKDNWNKLKEYIVENNKTLCWTNNYDAILGKMEELQGSDNNDRYSN